MNSMLYIKCYIFASLSSRNRRSDTVPRRISHSLIVGRTIRKGDSGIKQIAVVELSKAVPSSWCKEK